jgi:hypothetical protein
MHAGVSWLSSSLVRIDRGENRRRKRARARARERERERERETRIKRKGKEALKMAVVSRVTGN